MTSANKSLELLLLNMKCHQEPRCVPWSLEGGWLPAINWGVPAKGHWGAGRAFPHCAQLLEKHHGVCLPSSLFSLRAYWGDPEAFLVLLAPLDRSLLSASCGAALWWGAGASALMQSENCSLLLLSCYICPPDCFAFGRPFKQLKAITEIFWEQFYCCWGWDDLVWVLSPSLQPGSWSGFLHCCSLTTCWAFLSHQRSPVSHIFRWPVEIGEQVSFWRQQVGEVSP